jgi:hypothetical protein
MGAAGNRGREIHDPSPGDIASVSMVKVWPTLKDPEGRHIPEPGGDKGPNSQVGMTKHVIPPGSRKTKKEIQCVTNLAQTHNIEETVTRPPPTLEGTGNPEQYATFDRANGHRQIPFKEFGHAETWMIQNLPPKQWYQAVPECCNIEGFFGNFRPSTDARNCWTAQQARDVNNPQFRSCRTDQEESRRAIGERKMSGEKSEPTDQHKGIFECIQREGESNRDWIRRHLRGVHAYR